MGLLVIVWGAINTQYFGSTTPTFIFRFEFQLPTFHLNQASPTKYYNWNYLKLIRISIQSASFFVKQITQEIIKIEPSYPEIS